LKEKVGPKVQGKPERSARFALPTHSNTQLLSSSFMFLQSLMLLFLQAQLFQKPIVVEYLRITNDRRCIPLAFFKASKWFSLRGIRRAVTLNLSCVRYI